MVACWLLCFGGALVVLAVPMFDRIKIDDPVGAISVHLVVGIWGTLATGIWGEGKEFGVQLLAVFAYGQGNYNFASYLKLPYLIDVQEIVVFCAAIIGSILGFLWYNAYPAKIFMGDVGSLSLGATFATISVLLKQELVWGIMSALFVAEALSVIFQVLSYRYRRQKRIFKMSPLHHHFELSGWSETQTVTRFWIISIIFLVISLLSLKIR